MITDALVTDVVTAAKFIDAAVLTRAGADARGQRMPLAAYLVDRRLVVEDALFRAIAEHLGVPFVALGSREISPATLALIPAPLAVRAKVIPFHATPTTLAIAMLDPDDLGTIELLRRSTGRDVIAHLTTPAAFTVALRGYRKDIAAEVQKLSALSIQPEAPLGEVPDDARLRELAEDLPVVRVVDTLLEHALAERASDIHLEPAESSLQVRYRIDGILRPIMTLPREIRSGVVARVKILAGLKIDEHRLPQDGRFKVSTPTERVAVRVAVMPVIDGEKVVLRLLREEGERLQLADLGLRATTQHRARSPLAIVEAAIRKPHGIVFITGPTGSGKTTTLYAIVNTVNVPGVNIATIEDPIEYRMPGVNQSQVNARIQFTFATGLRALLRQDPNIIMVGEIRDAETADVAVNAALTGHLVLSTLHTNDSPTALPRLVELGVPVFLIASTMNAILGQRLVRRLCPACRKPAMLGAEGVRELGDRTDLDRLTALLREEGVLGKRAALATLPVFLPIGCARCTDGYRGRIGIFEVLEVTPAIVEVLTETVEHPVLRAAALREGMVTMLEDGVWKAAEGTSSIAEVIRVTRE